MANLGAVVTLFGVDGLLLFLIILVLAGIWYLVFGILVFGIWYLVFGILVFGI